MAENYKLNHLPHRVLNDFKANAMVLRVCEDMDGQVLGTTNFNPNHLRPVSNAVILERERKRSGVYAITVTVFRVTPELILQATDQVEDRFRIISEFDALLRHKGEAYAAYVVTHYNRGPLGEMTVFVGGDCYRQDQRSFEDIFGRTRDLAQAMLRKAVTVFSDLPALHGGKKGEWIIVDPLGHKIDYLTKEAIVALGTLLIPTGIQFLDDLKEMEAHRRRVLDEFPTVGYVRPDTGSPDVLSGEYWERMCDVWRRRRVPLGYFTCMPAKHGGPPCPSSKPTGYGVATTALALARHIYKEDADHVGQRRFLLEALGGVGSYTIESLLRAGVPAENIVGFDPDPNKAARAQIQHRIRTYSLRNTEFYRTELPKLERFDVWINNGLGDDVQPTDVDLLLKNGVRVFCGAANNFLQKGPGDAALKESLQKIFSADAVAWPDEAASGGGWTLAVLDLYARCQGRSSNNVEAEQHILDIITVRNRRLVDEVVAASESKTGHLGERIWRTVNEIIQNRVDRALQSTVPANEVAFRANVKNWKLV